MKSPFLTLNLLALIFIIGCADTLVGPLRYQSFLGTWVATAASNDTAIMRRAQQLDTGKYGFVFHSDGRFIERKNAGWCGTPPVVLMNYAGEWKAVADSLVYIKVQYWGGTTEYKIRIILLTESELRFKHESIVFQSPSVSQGLKSITFAKIQTPR